MKRHPCAFTLIETLVSVVVLALIVGFACYLTAGMLSSVGQTVHRLDAQESVQAAVQTLRDELGSAIVSDRPDRYLNLDIGEDQDGIHLYLAVPRFRTRDLERIGYVEHVAYHLDRKTRRLARAVYHSSRDPAVVRATAHEPDSSAMDENLERLRGITPAYRGSSPYDWTTFPFWQEHLEQARRNPLLTDVAAWKIECFTGTDFKTEEPAINAWNKPDRLPAYLRMTFVIDAHHRTDASVGRRFTSLIALPCAVPGSEP